MPSSAIKIVDGVERNYNERDVHRAVLSTMKDGFVFQDLEGRMVEYNDAAFRILRMTPDQLEGKTSLDPDWCAVREDGSEFPGKYHPISISLKTGKACYSVIMGIRNYSEDTRWIEVNSDAVRDPETNEVIGAIATFSDVTSRILMKKAFDRRMDSSHADIHLARFKLQTLFLELTSPSNEMAGHAAIIKKFVKDNAAPDYVKKSAGALDATSEKLLRLLSLLGSNTPQEEGDAQDT